MRITVIIINILSVIITVGYFARLVFREWAKGFNPTGYISNPSVLSIVLPIIVLVVLIISLIISHVDTKRALIWSLLPIFVFAALFVATLIRSAVSRHELSVFNSEEMAKIEAISKDYMSIGYRNSGRFGSNGSTEHFITYDREHQVLVGVFVYVNKEGLVIGGAYPVGKVNGSQLEGFYESITTDGGKKELVLYTDTKGKTILDNFTVIYVAGQDKADYHLEKYTSNY